MKFLLLRYVIAGAVPWCITLDNSKGISRLRFWAKNSRVNIVSFFFCKGIPTHHQQQTAQALSEESAVALLFGLIASGQIQLRRIDGYQRLSKVLEHAEVAA